MKALDEFIVREEIRETDLGGGFSMTVDDLLCWNDAIAEAILSIGRDELRDDNKEVVKSIVSRLMNLSSRLQSTAESNARMLLNLEKDEQINFLKAEDNELKIIAPSEFEPF